MHTMTAAQAEQQLTDLAAQFAQWQKAKLQSQRADHSTK